MGWVSVCDPSFIMLNFLHLVLFIAIVLFRKLLCKVSYTLWFSISISLMNSFVISMSLFYKSADQKITPVNDGLSDRVQTSMQIEPCE